MGKKLSRILTKICFMLLMFTMFKINVDAEEVLLVNKKFPEPVVYTQVSKETRRVKVYLHKKGTLSVRRGKRLILKKKYETPGTKTVRIKAQKAGERLSFRMLYEDGSSKAVSVKVARKSSKARLQKPRVETENFWLKVKGRVGAKIYVRPIADGKKGKWIYFDIISGKEGVRRQCAYRSGKFGWINKLKFEVRLKGLDGKYSKSVTVSMSTIFPEQGVEEKPTGMPPWYSFMY